MSDLQLPGLSSSLKLDTAGYATTAAGAVSLAKALSGNLNELLSKPFAPAAAAVSALRDKVAGASSRAAEWANTLSKGAGAVRDISQHSAGFKSALEGVDAGLQQSTRSSQPFAAVMAEVKRELLGTRSAATSTTSALGAMTGQAGALDREVRGIATRTQTLTRQLDNQGTAIGESITAHNALARQLARSSSAAANAALTLSAISRVARDRAAVDGFSNALTNQGDQARTTSTRNQGVSRSLQTMQSASRSAETAIASLTRRMDEGSISAGRFAAAVSAARQAAQSKASAVRDAATATGQEATASSAAAVAVTALARVQAEETALAIRATYATDAEARGMLVLAGASRVAANGLATVNRQNVELVVTAAAAALAVRRLQAQLASMRDGGGIGNVSTVIRMVDGDVVRLGGSVQRALPSAATAAYEHFGRSVSTWSPALAGGTEAVSGLGAAGPIAAVGIAAIAIPLTGAFIATRALRSEMVSLAADMEQTSVAFEVLVGSSTKAKALLDELRAFADTTPFQFPEVAGAAKQLLAMGIDAEYVTDTLRRLGDVSAGLGQPLGEVAYLYGQIRSQSRAMTQDLNQFASRGIPIYASLAKVLGTNELGVRKLAESGKIGFNEIQRAIVDMTDAGGRFAGMTEKQAGTLKGLQSTLDDAFAAVKRGVGESLVEGLDLKGVIKDINSAVVASAPLLRAVMNGVMPIIRTFVDAFRGVLHVIEEIGNLATEVFGEDFGQTLGQVFLYVNPLTVSIKLLVKTLDLAAWTIRQVADAIKYAKQFVGFAMSDAGYGSGRVNVSGATNKKKPKSIKDLLDQPTTGDGEAGLGGTGAVAGSPASAGKQETDAAKERRKLAELDVQIRINQLRAAGKAAEADLLEMYDRFNKQWQSASTDAERQRIQMVYQSELAIKKAKEDSEQAKATSDAQLRASDAAIQARTSQLRAAGREVEADILQLWDRIRKASAEAKSPEERAALEQQYQAERSSIIERENRRQFQEQERVQKESDRLQDERQRELAESMKRSARYTLDAQMDNLRTAGRAFEAEMLAFDQGWKERIENATTNEERYTATLAYEAARRMKIREEENRQAKDAGASGLSAPTLDDLKARAKDKSLSRPQSALAQLDLREALELAKPEAEQRRLYEQRRRSARGYIGLSPEEEARRNRLREMLGEKTTPGAAFSGALDGLQSVQTPGQAFSGQAQRNGYVAPPSPARTQPSAPAGPQVSLTNNVNVSGPSAQQIASVLQPLIEPVIDRKIREAQQAARAATYASTVGGDL